MLGWLQSILAHARAIGRFWYSVAQTRGSVNLSFKDLSHATVTRTAVQVEGDDEATMAGLFAKSYLKAEAARRNLVHPKSHGSVDPSLSDAAQEDMERQQPGSEKIRHPQQICQSREC